MDSIDARGFSCPQPMLMARKAMQEAAEDKIEVLVDCAASVENIGRAAKQLGWELRVTPLEGDDEARLELTRK